MTLLAALWSRVAGYVAAAGLLILALFSIWLKGRTDGASKAKMKDVSHANEIRRDGAAARASVDASPGGLRKSDGFKRD